MKLSNQLFRLKFLKISASFAGDCFGQNDSGGCFVQFDSGDYFVQFDSGDNSLQRYWSFASWALLLWASVDAVVWVILARSIVTEVHR